MKLLEVSPDSLSLEFAPYERAMIMERLGQFGTVVIAHEATYDRVRVAGIELIYLDEWDEPCLISSTPAGNALLKGLSTPPPPPKKLGKPGFPSALRKFLD